LVWIPPVFDSILWFTVPIPRWNNGFCQRWSISGLPWDIRQNSKFSTNTGVRKLILIWNRMRIRICDLKRFIQYSGLWYKFLVTWPLGESFTLLNHLNIIFRSVFSVFLFHSESVYALLQTHIWIVFWYGKCDWTKRIGYECYFLKTE